MGGKGGPKARGNTTISSSEHFVSSTHRKQLSSSTLHANSYAFEMEIKQMPNIHARQVK